MCPVQIAVTAQAGAAIDITNTNSKALMDTPSKPPILISKFDQVLEQLHLLFCDIEEFKMDAGVVVMIRNGEVDVRGLGEVDSLTAASALLSVALRTMPLAKAADMMLSIVPLMERSKLIEAEAPLWRATPNLHLPPL